MPRLVAERGDAVPVLGEIFRKYGYDGASIGLIVQETGLGRSSLYHFFPGGKEEMARAVLEHVDSWFEENIFTPLETGDPDTALAHMYSEVASYFRSGRRICIVGAFALDAVRHPFAREIEGYFTRWIAALERCLLRRGLTGRRAAAAAPQIVALIQGAIVLSRATADPGHFSAALDAAAELGKA